MATNRQRELTGAYMEALYQLRDSRPNVFQGFLAEEREDNDDPEAAPSLTYNRALYRLRDHYRKWFNRLYAAELDKRGITLQRQRRETALV